MATNLEFINKTEATSIVSMDVTDVFTAKYDVYKLHISLDCDGAGYFEIRLLQADGSLANESKYDIASLDLKSNTSFGEYRFQDQNGGVGWRGIGGYVDDGDGYGITVNIFNPFANDKYTFGQAQSGSTSGGNLFGSKAIGIYKSTQSIGGYRIILSGGATLNYIQATTYGVK